MAIAHGGRYYLTYHRYASRAQVEACYPQFPEFLRLKKKHDPEERFQSEWYRLLPHDVRRRAVTAAGRRRYAAALWVLLGLFVLRVAGQLLIAVGAGGFLPPWEEWFSGALGYAPLFASQMLIIVVCGWIALDVTRGRGFFATPRRQVGAALLAVGSSRRASRGSIAPPLDGPRRAA